MHVTKMVKNSLKLFAVLFSSLQRSPLISIVLEGGDFFSPRRIFSLSFKRPWRLLSDSALAYCF